MKFKYQPIENRSLHDGEQYIFQFKNHYGASVIRHNYSYGGKEGLWELAVLFFDEIGQWDIAYDTWLTDDVLGYLTISKVNEILDKIKQLKGE